MGWGASRTTILMELVQAGCMAQSPRIREGSDRAFRRLFGHPEVVADLLRGFVPEPALAGFDTDSLRPLPDDRVDFGFNKRESDATWSFSLEGGDQVVMIFEAQSTEDHAMAGRMAVQAAMFCENFQRTRPGDSLPEVLPVVFLYWPPALEGCPLAAGGGIGQGRFIDLLR